MNLILDTHYKYDTFGRYYYLTPLGAELITGLDSLDGVWSNAERRLKSQGSILKTLMVAFQSDTYVARSSRQDIIEYWQYSDTTKRNAVLKMLGYMAEWAYDVDGDRIAYEERNPMDIYKLLPLQIKVEGKNSDMLTVSKLSYTVPEDEYQVGY